jgi:hypothetical protein
LYESRTDALRTTRRIPTASATSKSLLSAS